MFLNCLLSEARAARVDKPCPALRKGQHSAVPDQWVGAGTGAFGNRGSPSLAVVRGRAELPENRGPIRREPAFEYVARIVECRSAVKNKGKGGKNRKRGKNEAEDEKRELVFKEDGQEYAQVLRMLGNGRCEALCIDGTKRLCHIRGKMHKKVWIASGDIILVGLRDYQDDKADVILKYQPDEARLLKAYGELPDNVRLNEGIAGGMDDDEDGEGDDYIEFEDEDIDRI
ncbi:hypothetical protein AXG93_402s1340 [Marchantia polymorpha subsp. ruderalis]|uniref:Eukaryotic translation initiation factor 4C n=1 Tax=Marchantia polymorpha subsp. ruderalis TaxID=1480154 RepID=A0A176WDN5_MARPO|nr:hypothetical protein AXG93_402s1340 [Marchantia polymorpha subsp. ruderalis]